MKVAFVTLLPCYFVTICHGNQNIAEYITFESQDKSTFFLHYLYLTSIFFESCFF